MSEPLQKIPFIPAERKLPEITVRAVLIAIIVTMILAASNAYLALKLGSTIAASIPAAVIAMGVLRFFKNSNLLEANIVQTAASAGEGVAAAVAFVLPALILVGYWQHFPYWQTVSIVLFGAILGVVFSVPLRRIMLNYPGLRFPEGTAIGNVLISSSGQGKGAKDMLKGGLFGALVSFCQDGLHVIANSVAFWGSKGGAIFGMSLGFAPAMIAAGYIVGFSVTLTMFVGLIVGWGIALPLLSLHHGITSSGSAYDTAMDLWSHSLRYIGVGTMVTGGLWTLLGILKPIGQGIKVSVSKIFSPSDALMSDLPRTQRDLPMGLLGILVVVCIVALYFVFVHTASTTHLPLSTNVNHLLSAAAVVAILVLGFLLASISAYFAGLIGSSNSPLSGLLIAAVLLLSLLLLPVFKHFINLQDITSENMAVAVVIVVTTCLATAAAIALENMQDLKAGQIVGATPWKQQAMLILGVAVATFVVAPVFELLFQAYGLGGVYPHAGMNPENMLAAPQAGLMEAVAKGVFSGQLPWHEIRVGVVVAIVAIVIDEIVKRRGYRFPVLALGLGIYVPPEAITAVFIGGLIHLWVQRRLKGEAAQSEGTLLACGIVAGASIMGVLLAVPFVIAGSSNALSLVGSGFTPIAELFAVVVTVILAVWLVHKGSGAKQLR